MAEEQSLAPDYEPIEGEDLAVYELPEMEVSTTSLEVLGVLTLSPFEGSNEAREYNVTVEFKPWYLGLDDGSFDEYLQSFQYAKISQETMVKKIREDLKDALDLDDVFVEVQRTAPANKRVRLGKP